MKTIGMIQNRSNRRLILTICLFSIGMSKACCLVYCTTLSGRQLFSSGGTWVYLLQHFNLARASESFISGDFICLILAFISSPLSTFLYDVRRENSKVEPKAGCLTGATVLKRLMCFHFESPKNCFRKLFSSCRWRGNASFIGNAVKGKLWFFDARDCTAMTPVVPLWTGDWELVELWAEQIHAWIFSWPC